MKKYFFIVMIVLIGFSCKKEKPIEPFADVTFNIRHKVSGSELLSDTLIFKNAAENIYSITRVEYYLSAITFHIKNGTPFITDNVELINAFNAKNDFEIFNIPAGEYSGMSFYIGVEPTKNVSDGLPNTMENINMAWPEQMGGGYHFIKYEGHFQHADTVRGYALHLGLNPYLIKVDIDHEFTISAGNNIIAELEMDLNKWFDTPNIYDLTSQKAYTMGDAEAMGKISENGKNVFQLKSIK